MDIVLECIGKFDDRILGLVYINVGVGKVFFFLLGIIDLDNIVIFGINEDMLISE